MSCFVHTERELNTLGKYFKEVIKLEAEFTDHLIFNLYQFELISVNSRYEENSPSDILMYKDEEYEKLELISSYDALKLLDSIVYQAAGIESKILWNEVLNVHKKLTEGIVKIESIKSDYKNTVEYEDSCWW
ncbi:hypothetical protein BU002_02260 [Mammaliicoccus sciuri]|uniref:hypothetical protein n=1 Tax=Mammaliicoccus sciuri TaxID=1296 RepID=UPI000E6860C8|nr:hypothetical protein [Mammaliicoccus sciuri]RIN97164.1 hypothetical protein BU002_02260 [Mammaliicoccus sciuri]